MSHVGNGNMVIILSGETILFNGIDITGNLGSKATYGDYSPIIDIKDSKVNLGNFSGDKNAFYTIIAMLLAIPSSIIAIRKLTNMKKGKKTTDAN